MNKNMKILDCTIRDGGLVNNWDFSVDFVRDVYHTLNKAGVDYMEIGYKNSPKLLGKKDEGPWRFLDDSFLKEVLPEKKNTKLSALVDVGRVDEEDILPREESMLDLIRVACYIKDVTKALDLVEKFHRLGYETSLNIMAVSNAMDHELTEALEEINNSNVDIAYVVDSYGSLFNKDMDYLISRFQNQLPNKVLGVHTHNNLQMAFSNTILGVEKGVVFLDSSIYGMGRAAGNCPTELLLGSLDKPGYDIAPVLDIIERRFVPLRETIEWGYNIPYAINGLLNEHPRTAMALRNSPDKDRYLAFYEKMTSAETVGSK